MYLGYGGRIPWWRWLLVIVCLPWIWARMLWRDWFPPASGAGPAEEPVGILDGDSPVRAQLLKLESELANGVFRHDPTLLEARFHPEFVEVGSSGAVVDLEAAMRWILERSQPGGVAILDTEVSGLGAGMYLVRYRSMSESGRSSWRASLWQRDESGNFRIRYHQGTPVGT